MIDLRANKGLCLSEAGYVLLRFPMVFVVLLYQHPSQTKHKRFILHHISAFTESVGYFCFIIWGSVAFFSLINVCFFMLQPEKMVCLYSFYSPQ